MSPASNHAPDLRPHEVDVPREFATSQESIVRFLSGELAATCGIPAEQLEHVVGAVTRREALGSMGIGRGVALPNARSDVVSRVGVVIGRLPDPMDWNSIDAAPVRLVCLILSPRSKPGAYLRTLEIIVRRLSDQDDR